VQPLDAPGSCQKKQRHSRQPSAPLQTATRGKERNLRYSGKDRGIHASCQADLLLSIQLSCCSTLMRAAGHFTDVSVMKELPAYNIEKYHSWMQCSASPSVCASMCAIRAVGLQTEDPHVDYNVLTQICAFVSGINVQQLHAPAGLVVAGSVN
jgi:hypothetical protein